VKRSTVNGSGYAQVTNVTTTSYTNTGLTNGTTYYFVVNAQNAGGASANSSQVSATPSSGSGDTAQYNFESGVQGWFVNGAPATAVAQSTAQHYAGNDSLAITMNGASGCGQVSVMNPGPGLAVGSVITAHFWVPTGFPNQACQLSVSDSGSHWYGNGAAVTANQWNTVTLTIPSGAVLPITEMNMQYCTNATWSGTVYLDSISW
jgi:hypothetical protein